MNIASLEDDRFGFQSLLTLHLCISMGHFPSNLINPDYTRLQMFSHTNKKENIYWAYCKEIRRLHSWKMDFAFNIILQIDMVAFSKQSEKSWLQIFTQMNKKSKKEKNIFGPTIKKFEHCIVER